MTQTNTVNPKAGTLKQKNGRSLLLRSLSKIASLLLMSIMTVSTMALEQGDDSIGNGSTTNGTQKMLVEDSCCTVAVKNAGAYKSLVYRVPSVEMIRKADSEVSHNFHVAARKAERIDFTNDFVTLSDAEMHQSFNKENNVVLAMPATSVLDAADAEMEFNFTQEAASTINVAGSNQVANADAEMNSSFADANIRLAAPEMVKADNEINQNFEADSKNLVAVPKAQTIANSDAEMHRNLASEKQFKQLKNAIANTNKKRIVK